MVGKMRTPRGQLTFIRVAERITVTFWTTNSMSSPMTRSHTCHSWFLGPSVSTNTPFTLAYWTKVMQPLIFTWLLRRKMLFRTITWSMFHSDSSFGLTESVNYGSNWEIALVRSIFGGPFSALLELHSEAALNCEFFAHVENFPHTPKRSSLDHHPEDVTGYLRSSLIYAATGMSSIHI